MYIYYIIFFSFGIIAFKDLIKSSVYNRYFLNFIIIIFLIIFIGFRNFSDNDFKNYVILYEIAPVFPDIQALFNASLIHGQEIGYLLIESILKALGFGYQSIFIFSAIIVVFFLYKSFQKLICFPVLALFIFFALYFTLMFVQMRFGIATALSLYACSCLSNGKNRMYWLFIIIALLFHYSSFGIIPVFFLNKINWLNKGNINKIIIISIIILFIPVRPLLEASLSIFEIERYARYITGSDSGIRYLVSIFFTFIIIVPFIIFRKKLSEKNIKVNILLSMIFSGIIISAFVWRLSILNRLSIINISALCAIIPSYLLLINNKFIKICSYSLIFLYCLLRFLPAMEWVTDYKTFFNFI